VDIDNSSLLLGDLSLLASVFFSLFVPWEEVITTWFVPVMSVMLPIMIIEAIAGSYIGYKIYRRVEKL